MKLYKISTILVLVLFTFLVACSNESLQEVEKNSSNAEGNIEAEYVFRTTIQTPEVAALSLGFDAYLDAIEEKSGNRITFERYYSETLAKASDALEAISSGVADIGVFVPYYTESKTRLSTIGSLPGLYENSWVGARAYFDTYENVPAMNEEIESQNVKFIGSLTNPSNYIFTKDPINSIEDLKGMRIAATGVHAIVAQELGTTPVALTSTEAFEAIQKGTADGAIFNLSAATTYNIEEVANHVYKLPIGGVALAIGMNLDIFEELPEDLQVIFMEVAKEHADDFHEIYQINGDEDAFVAIEEADGEIIEPSSEDIEEMLNIIEDTIWKKFVEDNGSAGQEVLDYMKESVEKYKEESPYK